MRCSSDQGTPGARHLLTRCAVRGSEITGFVLAFLLISLAAAAADCTCRARGHDYQHGERVCLAGPEGPRLATCGMSQNVASWLISNEACTVSALELPVQLAVETRLPEPAPLP